MRLSKYVKLGILMVFSITTLIWGLSYLKGHDFFKPVDYYFARYKRVDGLQESSYVTVNGFRVGNVKNIRFTDDKSGDLLVTFMIDNDFKIPANSVARIISSDIMGTRSVKLEFSGEDRNFSPGDTIPGEIESDLKEQVSLQVLPLKNKAEELLSTLDSAITVLTVIFNEDARENLSESFANINRTIYNLERTSADLQQLMSAEKGNLSSLVQNLEGFSGTLNGNSARFDNIITQLSGFTDSLATQPITPVMADITDAVGSLQEMLGKINAGENSAGLLLNDDELYKNITGATSNLEHLIADIRNNPKRYLHFSAIDLGRVVHVSTPDAASEQRPEIIFKVYLTSVPQPIPSDSPLFAGLDLVEEYETEGGYTYYSGEYPQYADAERAKTMASRNFQDASVEAFRDGKTISLDKAFRLLKK